jgi:hypothetical protein
MMKKLIIVVALSMLGGAVVEPVVDAVVTAVSATAHGTCTITGDKPVVSVGQVVFKARSDCHGTYHNITTYVNGFRRIPGQAWVQVASAQDTDLNVPNGFAAAKVMFNCNKDYKTIATFQAAPGPHSGTNTSAILTHTC